MVDAYYKPSVNDSTEKFSWQRPDVAQLRNLCTTELAMSVEAADERLLPAVKAFDTRSTQSRLDKFVVRTDERAAKVSSLEYHLDANSSLCVSGG